MKYKWVIFDADETLFRFDNYVGLVHMFKKHYDLTFTQEHFDQYQALNKPLWVEYQDGKINATELQTRRFSHWSNILSVPAETLNSQFLDAMGDICENLPGASELVTFLNQQNIKMAIITNGFTQLQKIRLERTGMKQYFSHVVISEKVGVAKPHKAIFDYALNKMGSPDTNKVLMIGDTLSSDIQGGINAGIDTCWINHHNQVVPASLEPTYEVKDLYKLKQLFLTFN